MYFNHDEILEFCDKGYMKNWEPGCVNAASLDIRLGSKILLERGDGRVVDYRKRERLSMFEMELDENGVVIRPGEFFLAHSIEHCDFPDDVAAFFRIKSSMGRIGLEHMDAGWVDPGFNGSLTLEFKNVTQFHDIRIRPGDRIGQLVFFNGIPVSADKSYRTVGNYNQQSGPAQVGYRG